MSKQFINEVSRMKDLFGYKRGVVISEQKFLNEAEIPFPAEPATAAPNSTYSSTWNPVAQYGIKGTKVEEYPECVRAFGNPTPNQDKTQYAINGTGEYKGFQFYANSTQNGRVLKPDGTMGDYTCFNGKINIYGNNSTAPAAAAAAAAKQPTQWTKEPATLDDSNNTLKKRMTGEKVKQLQTGLDIKGRGGKSLATGKFWTLTDTKLKQLYPNEYTTQKGVTKTLFDKIVNPTLKASTAAAPTTIPLAGTQAAPATGVTPAPELKPIVAPTAATTTPADYYNTLFKAGFVQGAPEEGDNKIKINAPKGQKMPNLSKEQQELITNYLNSVGYDFYRKGDDNRLVYTKR
jgi:hypothetical protein